MPLILPFRTYRALQPGCAAVTQSADQLQILPPCHSARLSRPVSRTGQDLHSLHRPLRNSSELHAIILASALRLDGSVGSVVAKAAIIPYIHIKGQTVPLEEAKGRENLFMRFSLSLLKHKQLNIAVVTTVCACGGSPSLPWLSAIALGPTTLRHASMQDPVRLCL
jgi:hypothetical protein